MARDGSSSTVMPMITSAFAWRRWGPACVRQAANGAHVPVRMYTASE
jgi:hypothetical protein